MEPVGITEAYRTGGVWHFIMNPLILYSGDKAFGDFLSDEIKEEKKIQKNKTLPKVSGGWELELNGSEAKLTKIASGDK